MATTSQIWATPVVLPDPTMIERQLEVERYGITAARLKYETAIKGRASDPALTKLVKQAVLNMTPEYERLLETKRTRNSLGLQLLLDLVKRNPKLTPATIAWVAVTRGLSVCREIKGNPKRPTRHASLCNMLAKQLLLYAQIGDYTAAVDSGGIYVRNLCRDFDSRQTSEGKRRRLLNVFITENSGITCDTLEPGQAVALGGIMLGVLLSHSGLVETFMVQVSKTRRAVHYSLSDQAAQWITNSQQVLEASSTYTLPMVIPPKPWCDQDSRGPYLCKANAQRFVRLKPWVTPTWNEYTDMPDTDFTPILNACSRLGAVPYAVNNSVLDVLGWGLETCGGGVAGLPSTSPPEMPAWPLDPTEEAVKKHRYNCAKIRMEHARERSRTFTALGQLQWARYFRNEPNIYFPHNVDTRGRVYQLPTTFGPQTDDVGKALVRFALGKRLGPKGTYWFAVHGANTFGMDKIPLDARAQWALDNAHKIREVCEDPITNQWWHDADKPWQFLAWACEWSGFERDGPDHVSHIPIAQDGTCSGLQHLSALGRDAAGALATNLCDSSQHDIYTEVLEVVKAKLNRSTDPEARVWIPLVDRNLVKRPTMTTPYGVTHRGVQEQLFSEVKAKPKRYDLGDLSLRDRSKACGVLGKIIQSAIGKVVKASREIREWLKTCTGILVGLNVPIAWVTPSGFPWVQEYRKGAATAYCRINVAGRPKPFFIPYCRPTGEDALNTRKCKAASSPNCIHSLDAAHLCATVNAFPGTAISVVHDSFATHACDVDELRDTLRSTFADMYRADILDSLYQMFKQAAGDVEIPEPPGLGTWEVSEIRTSNYAFN